MDLGTSHTFNRNLLKIIAQYPDRVRSSNLFKLVQPNVFDQPTDIAIAITTTDLRISQPIDQRESPPSKNGIAQFAALAILLLSIGSELPITYFYFRRLYPTKVWFLLYSVLMVHLFSLAIVWVSFPVLAAFKTTGVRTAGIAWILMSLCYGLLVTVYYSIGKQPKKASTWVSGTIWFWLLNVVV